MKKPSNDHAIREKKRPGVENKQSHYKQKCKNQIFRHSTLREGSNDTKRNTTQTATPFIAPELGRHLCRLNGVLQARAS